MYTFVKLNDRRIPKVRPVSEVHGTQGGGKRDQSEKSERIKHSDSVSCILSLFATDRPTCSTPCDLNHVHIPRTKIKTDLSSKNYTK